MLSTIKFILKQLLPLKYETKYTLTHNGRVLSKHGCTWRMWLFKPFNIKHYELD